MQSVSGTQLGTTTQVNGSSIPGMKLSEIEGTTITTNTTSSTSSSPFHQVPNPSGTISNTFHPQVVSAAADNSSIAESSITMDASQYVTLQQQLTDSMEMNRKMMAMYAELNATKVSTQPPATSTFNTEVRSEKGPGDNHDRS